MTLEERYSKRLELEKTILDALLSCANTRNATLKSKLGIALTYLKNQWTRLVNYLMDGRVELSNNIAERSIKPFVVPRKNFLFAITLCGATSSAVIFGMIETAKAGGVLYFRNQKIIKHLHLGYNKTEARVLLMYAVSFDAYTWSSSHQGGKKSYS